MSDPTINLLRDLIAIDSVNPSLVAGGAGEGDVASMVAKEMRGIGMDVEVTEVAPGRPNVVGVLEGRAQGKSLMFCGHIDTVGVEGMSSPFDPIERGGRIYGRGSGDMKAGVAAMIEAARSLANSGGIKAGRLIVAAVVDEEYASIGAESLVKKWSADAAVCSKQHRSWRQASRHDLLDRRRYSRRGWYSISDLRTGRCGLPRSGGICSS
jgi:acetylornithine deacetylase